MTKFLFPCPSRFISFLIVLWLSSTHNVLHFFLLLSTIYFMIGAFHSRMKYGVWRQGPGSFRNAWIFFIILLAATHDICQRFKISMPNDVSRFICSCHARHRNKYTFIRNFWFRISWYFIAFMQRKAAELYAAQFSGFILLYFEKLRLHTCVSFK